MRHNINKIMNNSLELSHSWNEIFTIESEIKIHADIDMDIYDFPGRIGEISIEKYYGFIFDAIKYPDLIIYMVDANEIYNNDSIAQFKKSCHILLKPKIYLRMSLLYPINMMI